MSDFIKRLVYFILELQNKKLNKQRKINVQNFINTSSRRNFSSAASFELTSAKSDIAEKLTECVSAILKNCNNNPDALLEYVKRNGTKVYKIPFAAKLLKIVNCEEGLIGKTEGFKAFYLNLITSILSKDGLDLSFSKDAVFVVSNKPLDSLLIAQQFHKWYAMKLNLPGFDAKSQNNFEKFMIPSNDSNIKNLTVDEIIGLKDAIARDAEAINFVIDFAKSGAGSKQALKKMVSGGASV